MPGNTRSNRNGNAGIANASNPGSQDAGDPSPNTEGANASPPSINIDDEIATATRERDELLKQRELASLRNQINVLKRTPDPSTTNDDDADESMDDRPEDELRGRQSLHPSQGHGENRALSAGSKRSRDDCELLERNGRTLRPQPLPAYHGKSLKEHKQWVFTANTTFLSTPWNFQTDTDRVLFAMHSLQDSPAEFWRQHCEAGNPVQEQSWEFFVKFLLELLGDAVNRSTNVAQQYNKAQQRDSQSIREFDAYLNTLESHLEEYTESQRIQFRLTHMKPELRIELQKQAELPRTLHALIATGTRLEDALKESKALQSKSKGGQNSSAEKGRQEEQKKQDKAKNQGNKPQNKASGSQGKSRSDDKKSQDKSSVTCYNCGKKGHYANECKEERNESRFEANKKKALGSTTNRQQGDSGNDKTSTSAPSRGKKNQSES